MGSGGRNRGKHRRASRGSAGSVNGLSFSGNPGNGTNSSNNYGGYGSASAQSKALSSAISASKKKYPSYFANTGNWSSTGASASASLKTVSAIKAQEAKAEALNKAIAVSKSKYPSYFSNAGNWANTKTKSISSSSILAEQNTKAEALNKAIAKSKQDNPGFFTDAGKWSTQKLTSQSQLDKRNLTVRETKDYLNAEQSAYTKALRAGKVNLATALLNQRTTGGYKGKNTVNIETFLTERGYDLTKPETIPDSVFKPEKQFSARKQTYKKNMGDLNLKANKYKKIDAQPNNFFNTQKFKANAPLEFMGPTNQKRIENFKFLDDRPITLTGFVNNQYGKDMTTGEIKRLKTVGETTSPEMQFFGQFIQGSRNTFDSYGNMITNTGNFLQGKEQQPLARPPIHDQFFGAVIDSAKNTFEGKSENRASDPMGDFLNVQQKRIDKNGFGQVAGELTTEALFWALPVSPALKGLKIATSFFKPGVKTIKASDAFMPGKDFLKYEGKTKNISLSDYLGSFFNKGGKTTKVKNVPFFTTGATLGKATGKTTGKKKGGNNFFSGSSGSGKTSGGKFFDDLPKSTKTNTGLELILKNAPKTKVKPKPKTIQFEQFLKLNSKYEQKVIAKELAKQTKPKPSQFFKQLPKQKQNQFLKQTPKQKQLLKTKQLVKQNFFKPIPILRVNQKQQQKQQPFFKNPTKQALKITPKLKPKEKQKPMVGLVTPFFPQTAKTGGAFFPLPPFFNSGGRPGLRRTRKRRGQKAYTAWNVNTKQVGSFLKGPTYKKSKSDYIFKDLDKRTKKAKKEKGYDYLDFF